MGTIQTRVTRTHCTSGLTPWTGLDSHSGLDWSGAGSAQTKFGLRWKSRGLAIVALVLVTKLHQVNKTVFVFFPCVKLIFPRLDDVILHFHPDCSQHLHFFMMHTDLYRTKRNKLVYHSEQSSLSFIILHCGTL